MELKKPFSADNYECRVKVFASIAKGMSKKQCDHLMDDSVKAFKSIKNEKGGTDLTDMDGDSDGELDSDDVSPQDLAALEEESDAEGQA